MNRKTAEVREREGETNAGCGERVSKMVFVSLSFGVSLRNVQRLVKKMRRENRRITMAEGMLFRNGPELLSILRKQKGAGKRRCVGSKAARKPEKYASMPWQNDWYPKRRS